MRTRCDIEWSTTSRLATLNVMQYSGYLSLRELVRNRRMDARNTKQNQTKEIF